MLLMKFTIRPGGSSFSGGMAISAMDAREALNHVRDLIARGLTEVHILDERGARYDVVDLERLTRASEQTDPSLTNDQAGGGADVPRLPAERS
jgi:hypothetical protein